jgi:hypothetical protein
MATQTIVTCDKCHATVNDNTHGHTWTPEYPVHNVRIGYQTSPDSWVSIGSGSNAPPTEFHGIDLGELCPKCRDALYRYVEEWKL